MFRITRIALPFLVALGLSACASSATPTLVNPLVPQTDRDKAVDALLDSKGYAGKTPVKRIHNSRFNGWSYIDPQHIIVTFGVNKNFLIKFKSRCRHAESAHSMHFDTVMSNIIPGDRVFLGQNIRIMQPCWIDSIYALEKKPRGEKE